MYLHMSFDRIPHFKGANYGRRLGICCRFLRKSLKTLKKQHCISSSEVVSEDMKVSIQRWIINYIIGYILKATYIQNNNRRTHVAIISLIALKQHKLQAQFCCRKLRFSFCSAGDQLLSIQVFMTEVGGWDWPFLCIFQMPRDLLFLTLGRDCR